MDPCDFLRTTWSGKTGPAHSLNPAALKDVAKYPVLLENRPQLLVFRATLVPSGEIFRNMRCTGDQSLQDHFSDVDDIASPLNVPGNGRYLANPLGQDLIHSLACLSRSIDSSRPCNCCLSATLQGLHLITRLASKSLDRGYVSSRRSPFTVFHCSNHAGLCFWPQTWVCSPQRGWFDLLIKP
jgi:hypothetical protein